jgi:hypothetical protein
LGGGDSKGLCESTVHHWSSRQVAPTYNLVTWNGGAGNYETCNLENRAPNYVGTCSDRVACAVNATTVGPLLLAAPAPCRRHLSICKRKCAVDTPIRVSYQSKDDCYSGERGQPQRGPQRGLQRWSREGHRERLRKVLQPRKGPQRGLCHE